MRRRFMVAVNDSTVDDCHYAMRHISGYLSLWRVTVTENNGETHVSVKLVKDNLDHASLRAVRNYKALKQLGVI